jgi:hypothetical protein
MLLTRSSKRHARIQFPNLRRERLRRWLTSFWEKRLEFQALEERVTPTVGFDSLTGQLSILGDDGDDIIRQWVSEDGFVELDINGNIYSSNASSIYYLGSLAGATASSLHGIALDGGEGNDRLVIESQMLTSPVTIESDDTVQISGHVKADALQVKADLIDVVGALDVSGDVGGNINLEGDRIRLHASSLLNASGTYGGGIILIGGDAHGSGDMPHAKQVLVEENATIRADATVSGNGGKIVFWSDEVTDFRGTASARGGLQSGNGGFIEISGKNLGMSGSADVSAPAGTQGTILLDPQNIVISSSGSLPGGSIFASDSPNPGTLTIDATAFQSMSGDIIIEANNDITIDSQIFVSSSVSTLTFVAGRSIIVTANGSIDTSAGQGGDGADLYLTANSSAIDLNYRLGGPGGIYYIGTDTSYAGSADIYLTVEDNPGYIAGGIYDPRFSTAGIININSVGEIASTNLNAGLMLTASELEINLTGNGNGIGFPPIYELPGAFTINVNGRISISTNNGSVNLHNQNVSFLDGVDLGSGDFWFQSDFSIVQVINVGLTTMIDAGAVTLIAQNDSIGNAFERIYVSATGEFTAIADMGDIYLNVLQQDLLVDEIRANATGGTVDILAQYSGLYESGSDAESDIVGNYFNFNGYNLGSVNESIETSVGVWYVVNASNGSVNLSNDRSVETYKLSAAHNLILSAAGSIQLITNPSERATDFRAQNLTLVADNGGDIGNGVLDPYRIAVDNLILIKGNNIYLQQSSSQDIHIKEIVAEQNLYLQNNYGNIFGYIDPGPVGNSTTTAVISNNGTINLTVTGGGYTIGYDYQPLSIQGVLRVRNEDGNINLISPNQNMVIDQIDAGTGNVYLFSTGGEGRGRIYDSGVDAETEIIASSLYIYADRSIFGSNFIDGYGALDIEVDLLRYVYVDRGHAQLFDLSSGIQVNYIQADNIFLGTKDGSITEYGEDADYDINTSGRLTLKTIDPPSPLDYNIGTLANPLEIHAPIIDIESYDDGIYIDNYAGTTFIERLDADNGDIVYRQMAGDIYASDSGNAYVDGNNVTIVSFGGIFENNNTLDYLGFDVSGNLIIDANTRIRLKALSDLSIDRISNLDQVLSGPGFSAYGFEITIDANGFSLIEGNSDSDPDFLGNSLTITNASTTGSFGTSSDDFEILLFNTLSITAPNGIFFDTDTYDTRGLGVYTITIDGLTSTSGSIEVGWNGTTAQEILLSGSGAGMVAGDYIRLGGTYYLTTDITAQNQIVFHSNGLLPNGNVVVSGTATITSTASVIDLGASLQSTLGSTLNLNSNFEVVSRNAALDAAVINVANGILFVQSFYLYPSEPSNPNFSEINGFVRTLENTTFDVNDAVLTLSEGIQFGTSNTVRSTIHGLTPGDGFGQFQILAGPVIMADSLNPSYVAPTLDVTINAGAFVPVRGDAYTLFDGGIDYIDGQFSNGLYTVSGPRSRLFKIDYGYFYPSDITLIDITTQGVIEPQANGNAQRDHIRVTFDATVQNVSIDDFLVDGMPITNPNVFITQESDYVYYIEYLSYHGFLPGIPPQTHSIQFAPGNDIRIVGDDPIFLFLGTEWLQDNQPPTGDFEEIPDGPDVIDSIQLIFDEVIGVDSVPFILIDQFDSVNLTGITVTSDATGTIWTLSGLSPYTQGYPGISTNYLITTLNSFAITDIYGNHLAPLTFLAESWTKTVISTPPIGTFESIPDLTRNRVNTMQITFNQDVFNVTADDFAFNGVNLGTIPVSFSASGRTFIFELLSDYNLSNNDNLIEIISGNDIQNAAGDALALLPSEYWFLDDIAPNGFWDEIADTTNTVNSAVLHVNEDVTGVDLGDFVLEFTDGTTSYYDTLDFLTGVTLTILPGNEFQIDGLSQHTRLAGDYVIRTYSYSTIFDAAGNGIDNGISEGWTRILNRPSATWDPVPDTTMPVNLFMIYFDQSVTNVEATDFTINGINLGTLSNVSVYHNNATTSIYGSGLATLQVADGTYTISVSELNNIQNFVGDPLLGFPGESWKLDATRPTGSWFPIPLYINYATPFAAIDFSEYMNDATINTSQFELVTPNGTFALNTLAGVTIQRTASFTYFINGLAPYTKQPTNEVNTYIIRAISNNTITDELGNLLNGIPTQSWVVDTIPPTVTMPSIATTNNPNDYASITFNVSESVTNFTLAQLGLNGVPLSSYTGLTLTNLGSNSYRLDGLNTIANVGNPSTNYTLAILNSNLIKDLAGNSLVFPSPTFWTLDTVSPIGFVSSIDDRNTPLASIQYVFTKPVIGDSLDNVYLNNVQLSTLAGVTLSELNGIRTISGLAPYTAGSPFGNVTYTLELRAGSIRDLLGNYMVGSPGTEWVMDAARPTASWNSIADTFFPVTFATVTFSESVGNVSLDDFEIITPTGTRRLDTITTVNMSQSGLTFYIFGLNSVTSMGDPNFLYRLQLRSGTDILDQRGNTMASGSAVTWLMDTTAPTASFRTSSSGPIVDRNTPLDSVFVDFSEDVTGVSLSNFTLNGINLSTLSGVSFNRIGTLGSISGLGNYTNLGNPNTTYTLQLLPTPSIWDLRGNPLSQPVSATWLMDTTAPTATFEPIEDTNFYVSQAVVTFSEAVTISLSNFEVNGTNLGTVNGASLTNLGGNRYRIAGFDDVTFLETGLQTIRLVNLSSIVDLRGNVATQPASESWSQTLAVPVGTWDLIHDRNTPLNSATITFNIPVLNATELTQYTLNGVLLSDPSFTGISISELNNSYTIQGLGTYTSLGDPNTTYTLAVVSGSIIKHNGYGVTKIADYPAVSWLMDTTAPVATWDPIADTYGTVDEAYLRFSEEVNYVPFDSSFGGLEAPGIPGYLHLETLPGVSFIQVDSLTYHLTGLSAYTADIGFYNLFFAGSPGITDLRGNQLSTGGAAESWSRLASISAAWTFEPDRNQPLDRAVITFSENVSNVDLSDFALDGVKLQGLPNVAISNVGSLYTITGLASHTLDGNPNHIYKLETLEGNDITGISSGTPLFNQAELQWLMDTTKPIGAWVEIPNTSVPVESASIRFSEPVVNVSLDDFGLDGTPLDQLLGVQVTGSGREFTISGLGSHTATGTTHRLTVRSTNNIVDLRNNELDSETFEDWNFAPIVIRTIEDQPTNNDPDATTPTTPRNPTDSQTPIVVFDPETPTDPIENPVVDDNPTRTSDGSDTSIPFNVFVSANAGMTTFTPQGNPPAGNSSNQNAVPTPPIVLLTPEILGTILPLFTEFGGVGGLGSSDDQNVVALENVQVEPQGDGMDSGNNYVSPLPQPIETFQSNRPATNAEMIDDVKAGSKANGTPSDNSESQNIELITNPTERTAIRILDSLIGPDVDPLSVDEAIRNSASGNANADQPMNEVPSTSQLPTDPEPSTESQTGSQLSRLLFWIGISLVGFSSWTRNVASRYQKPSL